ncbi:excalibur calcium-binding domain-containing protein [Cohnella fermenti]|uniref:Excalibur calcium-binding domain-containing protein n=1 Tax=Cohnella fermenti TaxID=2565925 RepID=A0A4S4BFD5_9BACL|nr:excalibur calcium-binding domain-containing protein [Cohnella fermenti]THF72874.1 excalibur calcium-binding domain-containing protein [Cohnella fermenti]
MKKNILTLGACLLILSSFSSYTDAASSIKTYKNCTELNAVYKGGVAQSASVKNKGGKTKYKPYVSKELYAANKKLDRDKDLIACEK